MGWGLLIEGWVSTCLDRRRNAGLLLVRLAVHFHVHVYEIMLKLDGCLLG